MSKEIARVIPPRGWGVRIFGIAFLLIVVWGFVGVIQGRIDLARKGKLYDARIEAYIKNRGAIIPTHRHAVIINGKKQTIILQKPYPVSQQKILWSGKQWGVVTNSEGSYSTLDLIGGYGKLLGIGFTICSIIFLIYANYVFFKGRTIYKKGE